MTPKPQIISEYESERDLLNFGEQKLLELSINHAPEREEQHTYAADFRIGFRYGFRRGREAGANWGSTESPIVKLMESDIKELVRLRYLEISVDNWAYLNEKIDALLNTLEALDDLRKWVGK